MCKKYFLLIAVLLFCLPWWGCTPHDNIEEITPQYFLEELAVWDFTSGYALNSIFELIEDLNFEVPPKTLESLTKVFEKGLQREIRGVSISYRTIDPFGEPVVATGAFFYPKDLRPGGIVEIPPIALMHNQDAPSLYVERKEFSFESVPCMLGYITINPDFVGVRHTEEWPRPYLIAENAGLAAYHMRKAVEEYLLLTENYRLGNHSTIMGYSLGGSTSMAMVIIGLDKFYNLDLDYDRIFTNGMENPVDTADPAEGGDGYAYWFSGNRSLSSIRHRWGSNLRTYMHEDFFSPELNGEFMKLKEPLEANSIVYNWTPRPLLEIHLIHSAHDNLIPVECSDLLYREYKKRGLSITYNRTTGDHFEAGFEFIATAVLYLLVK